MDCVKFITQPVVDFVKNFVKTNIEFMMSCEKYIGDMSTSMTELKAIRSDVEGRMENNKRLNLSVPARVPGWLKEVEEVIAEVDKVDAQVKNVGNYFNLMIRREVGGKACGLIGVIKRLAEQHSKIAWINLRIPLGKVDSMKASSSSTSVEYRSEFESREETFLKVLKALEAERKSHMIALCGMGGVGKTTMMEKVKTVVKEKGMFSLIVETVIGEKTDPFAIQKAVAESLSIDLKEETKSVRADKLREWFKNYSEGGKRKILVILDDIWQFVDLSDIGLSPGIDYKVFLTSRSRDVCMRMDVEDNSIFDVKVLTKEEAQRFFWQFIKDSPLDSDIHKLGNDIVGRCQGLPIAIKTIAYTLKGKSKSVWDDTLTRLHHHDVNEMVNAVFELSYKNIEDEETKSVFLLCGLYPEDFDIPTEELVRYGWGLKLFSQVYTISQGRNRINACIENLLNTNLLIESNRVGCVKMHDLVLSFVLKMYTKVEHSSIINYRGNMSEWPESDTPDSCQRISLACEGLEEFPRDLEFPNLSFLKLTGVDKYLKKTSLRFPENFYKLMEKVHVVVYENMDYPLLPRSFEYSTNLRTLCLHECSLMFDCRSIGSLLNLEVLSFANCSIRKLPSTIKNLKKLKLLDLTGCVNLHIDDDVFKNLVKLEELYMKVAEEKGIMFTDGNFNEIAERSKNLSAIEIELFGINNGHLKRLSFNNLERFKISMGCFLTKEDEKMISSFENTLMLVSNKVELLESRINVLFEKTVVLHLQVDGMNGLQDLKVKSLNNLRVLKISECAHLRYLFTRRIAATLSKLEHLEVLSCDIMQTLIHDEDTGSETIIFPSLKFLSLGRLPKLAGLCDTVNVIELPQLMELRLDGVVNFTSIFHDDNLASSSSMSSDISRMQPFFNEKVGIPKLETLRIHRMNNLNNIWLSSSENVCYSMLKTIEVGECDRLANVFPRNPMSLLHHLKELYVYECCSIETIFEIDMGFVPQGGSSSLVSIVVERSENLRHVWSLTNVDSMIINAFEAVERIRISDCINFRNVFTPITTNFILKALEEFDINYGVQSSPEQQNNNAVYRDIALFSHTFHQLRTLTLRGDREAQVVFDMDNGHNLLPSLEDLSLSHMDNMSHVWKCNWNRLQQPKSLIQNLAKISVKECRSIKYLFSPLMFKFLSTLKHLKISSCDVMEEIVSNRDDQHEEMASTHTNVTFFPILNTLQISYLRNLQHIGGGGGDGDTSIYNQLQQPRVAVGVWSLCQYSRHIKIHKCDSLSFAIPSNALGHMQNIEELTIQECSIIKDVFEVKRSGGDDNNNSLSPQNFPNTIIIDPDLHNLRRLVIVGCHLLRDVLPFSTLESLTQLEYLSVIDCDDIRVIVNEEHDDEQVVVFPCMKTLELKYLPNLTSFFLGMNDFRWPVLDRVEIKHCPKMRMFTNGHSDSPKLKYVTSDLGENSAECGLDNLFHPTDALQQQASLDGSISKKRPWFFSNLVNVDVSKRWNERYKIRNYVLQHMQKINKLKVSLCSGEREIFETPSETLVVEVKEMEFKYLHDIKCLWKSKQWTVLKFPNLTKLSIDQCNSIKHVFTISMVASLLQLQELHISNCKKMEIILEDEKEEENDDDETRVNIKVEFPCLRSLTLKNLESIKGFCLGMETIHWPSLVTLRIQQCPQLTTFTNGESTTPNLNFINTSLGLCECDATEGVNSFIQTTIEEAFKFGDVEQDR